MSATRGCETVLRVIEDAAYIDLEGDALRARGVAVLLTPGFDRALSAMRAGFAPDAILVEVTTPATAFPRFLAALAAEPAWAALPVLALFEASGTMLQVAPRGAQRELPPPADAAEMKALLDAVCARAPLAGPGDALASA